MNKLTIIITLVSLLLNAFLTFVWGEANILLIGNWVYPFTLFGIYLVMLRKIDRYEKLLSDTNNKLDEAKTRLSFNNDFKV